MNKLWEYLEARMPEKGSKAKTVTCKFTVATARMLIEAESAGRGMSGKFEVMHQTGEHDWEMACGPYETYELAEKARQGWFRKDEIPHMRVVQFFLPSSATEKTDIAAAAIEKAEWERRAGE